MLTNPKIIDIVEPDGSWCAAWGPHPLQGIERDGRCALCGQAISWRVVVQDETGTRHVIGRDCARSIAKIDSRTITNAIKRAEARSIKAGRISSLKGELEQLSAVDSVAAAPHPMRGRRGWADSLTLADYARWWIEAAAKPSIDVNSLAHAVAEVRRIAAPTPVRDTARIAEVRGLIAAAEVLGVDAAGIADAMAHLERCEGDKAAALLMEISDEMTHEGMAKCCRAVAQKILG